MYVFRNGELAHTHIRIGNGVAYSCNATISVWVQCHFMVTWQKHWQLFAACNNHQYLLEILNWLMQSYRKWSNLMAIFCLPQTATRAVDDESSLSLARLLDCILSMFRDWRWRQLRCQRTKQSRKLFIWTSPYIEIVKVIWNGDIKNYYQQFTSQTDYSIC